MRRPPLNVLLRWLERQQEDFANYAALAAGEGRPRRSVAAFERHARMCGVIVQRLRGGVVSFPEDLKKFADYRDTARPSVKVVTVTVTPGYARRRLGLKKGEPLSYRGMQLRCIGSSRWRAVHEAKGRAMLS